MWGVPIQNLNTSLCTTTPKTVYDIRDRKSYTVTKLGDNNCWMTQNLRYTGTSSDAANTMTLNVDTSNVTSNRTLSYGELATGDTSADSYDQAKIHVGVDNNNDPTVWYNYVAASAGTVTGSSNFNNPTGDVCPAGWRLPTHADLSGSISYREEFNPVSGGYYIHGQNVQASNVYGSWWSSTTYNYSGRYALELYNSSYDVKGLNRIDGRYVRCIREPRTITGITYMQDINTAIIKNTANNTTKTLTDSRDTQTYSVAKINGNVWMTRNLAIGCNGSGGNYGSSMSSKSLSFPASNVTNTTSSPWNTPTASVDKNDNTTGCTTSSTTDCNSYTTARMKCSSTYGAWYNYAAISAGTITGSSISDDQVYDICPKGWRLPLHSEQKDILSYKDAYSPIAGGYYSFGGIGRAYEGYWWSSNAYDNAHRWTVNYSSDTGNLFRGEYERNTAVFARCIADY